MRSEFWWFQLFVTCLSFGVMFLDQLLFGYTDDDIVTPLATLVMIVTVLPSASVTARRLHDIGWSGWIQLPMFLTFSAYLEIWMPGFSFSEVGLGLMIVGMLYWFGLLLFLIKDSQPQTNKYGSNPKSPDMGQVFN